MRRCETREVIDVFAADLGEAMDVLAVRAFAAYLCEVIDV